jgi:hypothetical protein
MNANRSFRLPLALVTGAVGLIVVVQVANAIHPLVRVRSPKVQI